MTLTVGRERILAGENFAGNLERVNFLSLFPDFGSEYISTFFAISPDATTHGDVSGTDRISELNDERIGYGLLASQPTSGKRPAYQATSGPGGRPAAFFVSSRADELNLPAEAKPTGDHWGCVLYHAPANGGATFNLMGTDTADTGRHQLRLLSTGTLVYNVGTNGVEATPNVVRPNNTWSLAFYSWVHAAKRARVELLWEGGWEKDVDTDASAVLGTGDMFIGRLCDQVKIAFTATGNIPILEPSSDGDYERLKADIIAFVRERFGLNL